MLCYVMLCILCAMAHSPYSRFSRACVRKVAHLGVLHTTVNDRGRYSIDQCFHRLVYESCGHKFGVIMRIILKQNKTKKFLKILTSVSKKK